MEFQKPKMVKYCTIFNWSHSSIGGKSPYISLKNRPCIHRYLQFGYLKWPFKASKKDQLVVAGSLLIHTPHRSLCKEKRWFLHPWLSRQGTSKWFIVVYHAWSIRIFLIKIVLRTASKNDINVANPSPKLVLGPCYSATLSSGQSQCHTMWGP